MDKCIKIILISILLILNSCGEKTTEEAYQFHLHECTGENEFLDKNDESVNYYFSNNSNREAIESFKSLKIEIRHGWTENEIFFVGNFTEKIRTAKELNPEYYEKLEEMNKKKRRVILGTSPDNPYYEFVLLNWFINTPFKEWKETEDKMDIIFIKREELKPEDFEPFNKKFKLKKHSKKRTER